ncbi:LPS export ABC transporter periplasmic protein LptC [Zoogloeaceae bacteirum Par-f-2]|uniref:LPS export ABC transporter periplasmic protein LptC n=1 Tax=Pseudothauera hydrothermalis TaxID=2184083 RepID=UPI000D256511|nr:LPS export ABC transporter periplasmic protein LptC [Pseudothauera hydrothermalis]AVZ79994.1 LPS export ABC transporter periplasmic protein LptC [Zoogloeaceae bacteirum Par-f-2]
MRVPAHRLYPVIALALLAGGTYWLARISAPEDDSPRPAERGKPDFVATGARLQGFDANGRERYELLADRISHYPGTDVSLFDKPRLIQRASDGRRLFLTADSGEAYRQGDEVRMRGNVRGRRSGLAGQADDTLSTETLTVWPKDERVLSRSPVVLTRGNTVIHAQGLQADNIFGTLRLTGQVYATLPRSNRTSP